MLYFMILPISQVNNNIITIYSCTVTWFQSQHKLVISTGLYLTAGTTERIFETKPHLYDIYVNNQNVTTQSAALKDLLKVSSADREKFDKLNNLRLALHFIVAVSFVRLNTGQLE